MSTRLVVSLVLAAVLGLAVAGWAVRGSLGPAAHGPQDVEALRLCYPNDPDTLNPITASDTVSEAFQRQVYEFLADRSYPDPDQWRPMLATHWEFDEKNLEYTIHLRHGVMWHPMSLPDGTPLPDAEMTAADVKFTFDCILNKHVEAASLRNYYENPEAKDESQRYKIKVTIVDKYTVKVRWTEPYFQSMEFTLGIPVIPRHVFSVDRHGDPIALNYSLREFGEGFNNHWANTRMCGTGPMMYKSWVRGQRLQLVRNPRYWGEPFHFKRIVYHCIPNANTSTHKAMLNELDFVSIADKDQYVQCKQDPSVLAGRVKLAEYPYPGYRYIGYNLRRPVFQDVRFRRAISHAIPVHKIIDEVFLGLASPVAGPFMPGSSACDSRIKALAYDLDESRRLLAEAGWKDVDQEGVLKKQIRGVWVPARFDLMIYADASSYLTIAKIIQENCRKIGVVVQITTTKWALMLDKLNNKEFDAAMLGWATSWRADPYQLWHGSLADQPFSSNFVGYRNPRVDKLIDQLRVTIDEQKQIPLYHEIHRLIYDDQPYSFLFADVATAAYDARLTHVEFYKIRPCVDMREWEKKGEPTATEKK